METSAKWFLRKHEDGQIFGPVDFAKLKDWARAAQVSPLDMVSDDQRNWVKAPMLQSLHMDYLIQMAEDSYYGPTTEEAVHECLRLGEINADTALINCCTDEEKFELADALLQILADGAPSGFARRDFLHRRRLTLEKPAVTQRCLLAGATIDQRGVGVDFPEAQKFVHRFLGGRTVIGILGHLDEV
ncbi:MAG: hypothetical protein ACKOEG_04085, partial [Chthoniobacterales bacterium]